MEATGLAIAVFDAFHSVAADLLLLHAIKDSKDSIQSNVVTLATAQLQLTERQPNRDISYLGAHAMETAASYGKPGVFDALLEVAE